MSDAAYHELRMDWNLENLLPPLAKLKEFRQSTTANVASEIGFTLREPAEESSTTTAAAARKQELLGDVTIASVVPEKLLDFIWKEKPRLLQQGCVQLKLSFDARNVERGGKIVFVTVIALSVLNDPDCGAQSPDSVYPLVVYTGMLPLLPTSLLASTVVTLMLVSFAAETCYITGPETPQLIAAATDSMRRCLTALAKHGEYLSQSKKISSSSIPAPRPRSIKLYFSADMGSYWKLQQLSYKSPSALFCVWCNCRRDQCGHCLEERGDTSAATTGSINTFGINLVDCLVCILHLVMRITEKLIRLEAQAIASLKDIPIAKGLVAQKNDVFQMNAMLMNFCSVKVDGSNLALRESVKRAAGIKVLGIHVLFLLLYGPGC